MQSIIKHFKTHQGRFYEEYVWRKYRHLRTVLSLIVGYNNKFYSIFEAFTQSIRAFFENIEKYRNKISSLINDNFQTILPNHFTNSSCYKEVYYWTNRWQHWCTRTLICSILEKIIGIFWLWSWNTPGTFWLLSISKLKHSKNDEEFCRKIL